METNAPPADSFHRQALDLEWPMPGVALVTFNHPDVMNVIS